MADEEPKTGGFDTAKLIAGGFAVISGAVTLIGGYTGAVPRLIRNDDHAFAWAVALSLIAVGLALIGSQIGNRNARPIPTNPKAGETATDVSTRLDNDKQSLTAWHNKLNVGNDRISSTQGRFRRFLSRLWVKTVRGVRSVNTRGLFVALGFAAFIAAAWAMIDGLRDSIIEIDQAQISTTWKEVAETAAPIAVVKVRIDGVQTKNALIVTVKSGAELAANPTGPIGGAQYLYKSYVGANLDGVAEMTFEVEVPKDFTSLQIVASLDQERDCAGKEVNAPTTTPSPTTTSTIEGADFSCVALLTPIPGEVAASSTSVHTDPAPTTPAG